MQIQINTDHNIEVHEAMAACLCSTVEAPLNRFSDHTTRVEMHLSGENDKRCLLEARIEGRQPIAVTHKAASLRQAVGGAPGKLARSIESALGRAERLAASVDWTEASKPE